MRGIRAIVGAAALIAMAAGPALAQERGSSTSERNDRVENKKKKKSRKTLRSRKRPSRASDRPADGARIEFIVKSYPRGASIEVDGARVGTTPVRVRARPGRRVLAAHLSGHVDVKTTIEVEDGLGYIVFSLAPEPRAAKVAQTSPSKGSRSSGFGTPKLEHGDAMTKARLSLKRDDYDAALRYAEAALASKPSDHEAKMIATIASCGVGDRSGAKRYLPLGRSSYREISIKRCARLGVDLD